MGNVTTRGVPFDVIGASFYGYWHGTLAELQATCATSPRYGKDVVVVETAYPFTLADEDGWGNIIGDESLLVPGYPATPAGQAAWLRDLRGGAGGAACARACSGGTRRGPPSRATAGRRATPARATAWENQALFGYDDRRCRRPARPPRAAHPDR